MHVTRTMHAGGRFISHKLVSVFGCGKIELDDHWSDPPLPTKQTSLAAHLGTTMIFFLYASTLCPRKECTVVDACCIMLAGTKLRKPSFCLFCCATIIVHPGIHPLLQVARSNHQNEDDACMANHSCSLQVPVGCRRMI